MKNFSVILLISALAGLSGWWFGSRHSHSHAPVITNKKVLYYQSTMHPWVKSDKPGKCTVCGMELVPVYEGGPHRDAATTDIVILPEGSPNISGIKTIEVKRQSLSRTLRVAGMIDDDESKHRVLSAYTGGRIEKLFVNFEGAEVEKGEPLATFYSNEVLNAVREYKIAYKQGQSPLLTAKEMRLQQLGLSKEQIGKAPERSESEIFVDILAPMTGTVTKRFVYEGQYVKEGEKLFEIGDFSTMWFHFIAYEQDLAYLREGLPVTITTPSLPGRTIESTIKFINPNLDDVTRSARVRVEFENPTRQDGALHRKHEVLHKLYATAIVQLDAPEVLAVPRTAVIWPGNNPRLYVEQGKGAYQQRRVILGRAGDDFWEVLEGVTEGDRVVVSGNMLIDGQAQLNNLGVPSEESPPLPDPAMEMTAVEHDALEKYLSAVADLTDTLAQDDLGAFNAALTTLPPAPSGFPQDVPALTGPAADLAAARSSFMPLSAAVVDYAMQVRGHFPKLKIFRCPMSDMAGKGIPKNAKWIQFSARLRNPFMGKEMLECGAEVK
jgi:Cu(I)/Ag(I) efflux system membrane fusion protein